MHNYKNLTGITAPLSNNKLSKYNILRAINGYNIISVDIYTIDHRNELYKIICYAQNNHKKNWGHPEVQVMLYKWFKFYNRLFCFLIFQQVKIDFSDVFIDILELGNLTKLQEFYYYIRLLPRYKFKNYNNVILIPRIQRAYRKYKKRTTIKFVNIILNNNINIDHSDISSMIINYL